MIIKVLTCVQWGNGAMRWCILIILNISSKIWVLVIADLGGVWYCISIRSWEYCLVVVLLDRWGYSQFLLLFVLMVTFPFAHTCSYSYLLWSISLSNCLRMVLSRVGYLNTCESLSYDLMSSSWSWRTVLIGQFRWCRGVYCAVS